MFPRCVVAPNYIIKLHNSEKEKQKNTNDYYTMLLTVIIFVRRKRDGNEES